MSKSITTATRERAASETVQEWVDTYLHNIYGVDPTPEAASEPPPGRCLKVDEHTEGFVDRLRARFSELDLAPRDGQVTLFEIDRAIANPLLHFEEKDMEMLRLLRRYFVRLTELHHDPCGEDFGISRPDLDMLAHCMIGSAKKLRESLEEEYRA
jgi:hypothetical protein